MGQSWQRPKHEPRLGKLEVWVERARNLAPELHAETINTWTDADVKCVLMLMGPGGDGGQRCWRAESESKVSSCSVCVCVCACLLGGDGKRRWTRMIDTIRLYTRTVGRHPPRPEAERARLPREGRFCSFWTLLLRSTINRQQQHLTVLKTTNPGGEVLVRRPLPAA